MAINNVELPPYVSFYGLARDPFSQETEADIYYSEPNRKQRLDVMLHLAEYGNEVVVVIGPKGSGKTALLQQFEKNKHDNWVVAPITAQEGFDERKFLQQLYRQLNLKYRGPTYNELLNYIQKHFRHLHENAQIPIILIDNAEKLPVTALKKVLEIASLTDDKSKPLIRVMMFATENIKENLKQPQLTHLANIPMRSLDLPPLTEEQTAHYILHRTLAAKFTNKEIFNDATLIRVFRDSYGWPARINEVCQEILLNSLPKKQQEMLPEIASKSRSPRKLITAIILIAIIAGAGFVASQGDINSLLDQGQKLIASLTSKQTATKTDTSDKQATATKPKPFSPPAPLASKEPESLADKLRKRDASYQEINKQAGDKAAIVMTPSSRQEIKPDTKPTVKQETNPVMDILPELAQLKIQHGNVWIMQQNPGHYTMQVVAGQSVKTIEEFLDEHKVKDNIALYKSSRKDQPWYGLIYGNYENKALAVSAVSQLPKSVQKANPWIRDFNGIQNDIRKTQAKVQPPTTIASTKTSLVERLSKQPTLTERLSRPATVESKPADKPLIDVNRREEWILKQKSRHFTLQLMATENPDAIARLIKQYQLKNSIALYQTTRQGKPWHVLIYGIYPTESLANTGIEQLPPYLQQLNPTIRQYSDIHQDIHKAQQQ